MRMMMRVMFDLEKANEAIKSGSMGKILENALKEIKPEASYFTAEDGNRTGYFFFDMKDTTQIPTLAEPFFLQLGAKIEIKPVMNADDLKAGLAKLPR